MTDDLTVRSFSVEGPFEIPRNNGRISEEKKEEFKNEHEDLLDERGVYIFAIKYGRGYTPYYVGKTDISFSNQIFQNLNRFNDILHQRQGKPVFWFLPIDRKNGSVNRILEKVLIQFAADENDDILNKEDTESNKTHEIEVEGVYNSNKTPEDKETKFKKMLSLDKEVFGDMLDMELST